jgi:predicted nucleic acid-binding protein
MKERGATLGTCIPALCELEVGASQVRDPATYRKALARLLTALRIWSLDEKTAFLYGDVYHQLRQRGRVCSQVDIMLAALARQLDLVLLTSDRDFDALPGLSIENWLEP